MLEIDENKISNITVRETQHHSKSRVSYSSCLEYHIIVRQSLLPNLLMYHHYLFGSSRFKRKLEKRVPYQPCPNGGKGISQLFPLRTALVNLPNHDI